MFAGIPIGPKACQFRLPSLDILPEVIHRLANVSGHCIPTHATKITIPWLIIENLKPVLKVAHPTLDAPMVASVAMQMVNVKIQSGYTITA
jgi:hypothetical protein